jgi:outer membrane protein
MKKTLLIIALIIGFSFAAFSQAKGNFGYIDSEFILGNIPEYKEAQRELDRLAASWQKDIEKKFATIDSMYKKYQVEAITLPENLKQKREESILKAEQDAKDLQKKRFGKDGDLFKKREELVKPIQDRVFNAIEALAKDRGYAFIFDAAGSTTIVYADPKFDLNDMVMQRLGISVKE